MKLKDWIAGEPDMTQERLAATVGCSQPTLVRIMQGGNTTTDLAKRICEATSWKVTLDDLLLSDRAA